MVVFGAAQHGDLRPQSEKHVVVFVRLHDKGPSPARRRIAAQVMRHAANDVARLSSGGLQYVGGHGAGGGLAVGAGHGQHFPIAHQAGDGVPAPHDGNAPRPRFRQFGVLLRDGG